MGERVGETRGSGNLEARGEVVARGMAPDLGLSYEACLVDRKPDPSIMVIFGASGDLTARKLLPALYNLYRRGGLPSPFVVVGCSRKPWTRDRFRELATQRVLSQPGADPSAWSEFSGLLHYEQVEYEDPTSYGKLAMALSKLGQEFKTGGNILFHLAVPPAAYEVIAEMLGQAGLASAGEKTDAWRRIIVEKPFGEDLPSALSLNKRLTKWFREEQIFRIDHYLAKETVQNILVLRFANALFEPLWNRNHIQHVGILASEEMGVEKRAAYYDKAGVLRDMFQNHMLQLLSLVAMEPPSLFESDRVRDEKVKVFRSLRPWRVDETGNHLVLGQYGRGLLEGREVAAYREEEGVKPDSLTPTYALMKVFLDNWRWQGVPFYLVSGKRLARKLTQISIQFKDVPHSMFHGLIKNGAAPNRLVMRIHPEEKLALSFQTKNPGAQLCLRKVTMDFDYYSNYQGPRLEAYEKVLLDCLKGEHMLFWREDGVEVSWEFLTPILEACESCEDPRSRLHPYPAGSWGPKEASSFMDLIIPQEERGQEIP